MKLNCNWTNTMLINCTIRPTLVVNDVAFKFAAKMAEINNRQFKLKHIIYSFSFSFYRKIYKIYNKNTLLSTILKRTLT